MAVAERLVRVRSALSPREWARAGALASAVLLLHLVGWGVLLALVVPHHYAVGNSVFGVGLGVTAYALGARHAFDADHIAAIDNTTRKFMAEGRRPLSVGFWFSLGHSSVVMALCLLLAAGMRGLAGQVEADHSSLQEITGLVGVAVSGMFLLVIGLINLGVLCRIIGVWRGIRTGAYDEGTLEKHLRMRGYLNRI